MTSEFQHITVLLQETVKALVGEKNDQEWCDAHSKNPTFVDCTLGGGGHARLLLENLQSSLTERSIQDLHLIGIDQDTNALHTAKQRLQEIGLPTTWKIDYWHGNFDQIDAIREEYFPCHFIDGLIADLGVSSPQLDHAERGFSFRSDGPLDMRMNPNSVRTAADLIRESSLQELITIFRNFGEEPKAAHLAKKMVEDLANETLPLHSTKDFAAWVERILAYRGSRVHPATRVFQALRIAVNDELGALERLLIKLPTIMNKRGRVALISFHSLEDRLIKHAYRNWERAGKQSEDFELHAQGLYPEPPNPWGKEIPRGGITPNEDELQNNPRARSARLRIFQFDSDPADRKVYQPQTTSKSKSTQRKGSRIS